MKTIDTLKLSPFLRFARRLELVEGYDYNDKIALDARMLYILSGDGGVEIDGTLYPLKAGTLLCWQAGSRYKFVGLSDIPLCMIMLNFDFFAEAPNRGLILPIKPSRFSPDMLESTVFFTENADERGVFAAPSRFRFEPLMNELVSEYQSKQIYSEAATRGLLLYLLAELSRSARISSSGELNRSNEIIAYIRANLDRKLTYAELSRVFNYHPNHLSRIITRITGLPLHKYLIKLRIERALELLYDRNLSIAQIAARCGFSDTSSFSKRLRLETGLSPTEILRKKQY